jgi:16S rRNA (uracil1498-N3)-methyltransferase
MHRCLIPEVDADRIEVSGDTARHMATVLRLTAGQPVVVFDGNGREWLARVEQVTRRSVVLTIGEERTPVAEPGVRLTLAVGLLKGDQMSHVVRDATALGVWRIAPFTSQHTAMARPAAWVELQDRWQRIAAASAAQSGRAVVPEVASVVPFAELLSSMTGAAFITVEPSLRVEPVRLGSKPESATVFVGPEGGWAQTEIDVAVAAGARPLSLGPRTLRAELAPVVALASLWAVWGWE